MSKNELKEKVSVLAFEKKLVPSDGYMYETTWDERNKSVSPLKLSEKAVRGTVSHRLKKATDKDLLKLDMDIADPNPQTVDSCSLAQDKDTLKVSFTLKVLSGVERPSACNKSIFNDSYAVVAKNYIDKYGFRELAKRYATNIANARFLWRNRVGAENIEVQVSVLNGESDLKWVFNSAEIPLRTFESNDVGIEELASSIADALAGRTDFLMLEIHAYAQVGKSQEVYPSEELVMEKSNSKSKKSKILYSVRGNAAMHSQKIGNALRTIDTWYPDFSNVSTGPIAIEVYGAVTNLGVGYRKPRNGDFYTLFDKYARGESLANENEEHYVMAVLVRGGVFGESDKE